MKNFLGSYIIVLVFSTLIAVGLSSCSKEKEKPESKNETVEDEKSGSDEKISDAFKIEYEVSGPVTGTMEIYRKGDKYRSDLKTNVMNQSMNTSTFSDGKYVYVLLDAMGMKKAIKIPLEKYKKEMDMEKKEVDVMNIEEHLEKYEKTGSETILGMECDKYRINEGVNFSIYDNKYILKMGNPGMKMTAVNLNTDASISDDLFEPTEGVEFKEVESFSKGFER
jgi:hypothetical protein